MSGPGDFESELERELHRILDPIAAAPIPLRRAPSSGGIMKRLLGGAGAALGVKLLTGIAVAASAAVIAGAATEVAVTGSLNPVTWGQHVTQAVQSCKDTLRASGTRGIGPCVSAIANQHGQQVSDNNKSSKARENGNGKDKTKTTGNGNGNGNGNGKDKTKSTGNGNGNGNKPSGPGIKPGPGPESSMLLVM
jgi:hypothetical protein